MKVEISAGGVIFQVKNKEPQILLIKDHNDKWTFPKGLIEDGENRVGTAKREIEEEVGLKKLKLVDQLSSIGYWYRLEGELIKKTVHYFLFQAQGGQKLVPQKEEGISQARWFALEKALEIVGYPKTGKKLIKEAMGKIKRRN